MRWRDYSPHVTQAKKRQHVPANTESRCFVYVVFAVCAVVPAVAFVQEKSIEFADLVTAFLENSWSQVSQSLKT